MSTQKPVHTPTPWKVDKMTPWKVDGAYMIRPVDDQQYSLGATLGATNRADADFVVHAINCHSDLMRELGICVALLSETLDPTKAARGGFASQSQRMIDTVEVARAVLQRATGDETGKPTNP